MRFRYFITCLTFFQFATRFVSHIEVFLLHQVVGIFIKCSFHLLDFYFSLSICIFHNLASSFHSVIRVRSDAKCLPLFFFLSFFFFCYLVGTSNPAIVPCTHFLLRRLDFSQHSFFHFVEYIFHKLLF